MNEHLTLKRMFFIMLTFLIACFQLLPFNSAMAADLLTSGSTQQSTMTIEEAAQQIAITPSSTSTTNTNSLNTSPLSLATNDASTTSNTTTTARTVTFLEPTEILKSSLSDQQVGKVLINDIRNNFGTEKGYSIQLNYGTDGNLTAIVTFNPTINPPVRKNGEALLADPLGLDQLPTSIFYKFNKDASVTDSSNYYLSTATFKASGGKLVVMNYEAPNTITTTTSTSGQTIQYLSPRNQLQDVKFYQIDSMGGQVLIKDIKYKYPTYIIYPGTTFTATVTYYDGSQADVASRYLEFTRMADGKMYVTKMIDYNKKGGVIANSQLSYLTNSVAVPCYTAGCVPTVINNVNLAKITRTDNMGKLISAVHNIGDHQATITIELNSAQVKFFDMHDLLRQTRNLEIKNTPPPIYYPYLITLNGKQVYADTRVLVADLKNLWQLAIKQKMAEGDPWPIEGYGMQSLMFLKGVSDVFDVKEILAFMATNPKFECPVGALCTIGISSAPPEFTEKNWLDFTIELLRRYDQRGMNIYRDFYVMPSTTVSTTQDYYMYYQSITRYAIDNAKIKDHLIKGIHIPIYDPVQKAEVDKVSGFLATELGLNDLQKKDIRVVSVTKQTWNDGCVGWPGGYCTMSIVTGYRVVISLHGNNYEFHAGRLDPAKSAAIVAIKDMVKSGSPLSSIKILSSELSWDKKVYKIVLYKGEYGKKYVYKVDAETKKILSKISLEKSGSVEKITDLASGNVITKTTINATSIRIESFSFYEDPTTGVTAMLKRSDQTVVKGSDPYTGKIVDNLTGTTTTVKWISSAVTEYTVVDRAGIISKYTVTIIDEAHRKIQDSKGMVHEYTVIDANTLQIKSYDMVKGFMVMDQIIRGGGKLLAVDDMARDFLFSKLSKMTLF